MDPLVTSMFKFYAPTLIASRGTDGEMRIEGVASSTVRDHHGDQITEKALRKMAKSAIGMTIFLNHEYRVQDIFGAVEKARIVKTPDVDEKTGNPIFDMRFGIVVESKNPEAVKAWDMLQPRQKADGTMKAGTKLGLSIGAMVPEGGATFDKSDGGRYIVDDLDIVETSLVTLPANPRSWVDYAVKGLTGHFPDGLTLKRAELVKELSVDDEGIIEIANGTPDEEQASEGTGEPMEGTEVAEGETATLEATEDSSETQTEPDTTEEAEATEGEIDVEKTKVSIWETPDGKTMVIDTGRTRSSAGEGDQSAQDDPENAGGSQTTKEDGLDDPLIKSLTGQLAALKARHETEITTLTTERDAALAIAKSTIDQAATVLRALEAKPVGRKTAGGSFEDADLEKARVDLDSLSGIFDGDVMRMLKKGT